MKAYTRLVAIFAISLAAFAPSLFAQLTVPGADGSDGGLNITTNTVIDLSQAVTAAWDSSNSGANVGKGVYDSNKWAVVFKYSSVNIASNATVSFKNHASRAPVVWLVNGNVTIDGTLNLNGADWVNETTGSSYVPGTGQQVQAEPGPGGFRGGRSWDGNGVGASAGFGPGGGRHGGYYGIPGSFGSLGSGGGSTTYGNPSNIPLIGGSGGGGDGDTFGDWHVRGAAGGGAILIACSQTISVAGTMRANGGNGYWGQSRETSGGSGGAIRLIANVLTGGGLVQAIGGGGHPGAAGSGRIRIERVVNSSTLQVLPDAASVVPLPAGDTALLWLPSDGPTARIVSVGTKPAPADPRAEFGVQLADLTLPLVSSSQVVVETTNVESASLVRIRVTPRTGNSFTEVTADLESIVSTTPLVIRWTNNIPTDPGHSVLQARVVRP